MTTQFRTVRVFLSSTFRDFAEERDLLVRKVFPVLRRKCRERQVELVDVDLRWGITEKEAQQGKVLPICLAEIDRSRPWFMGFIGDRYGWVPESNQYDLSLLIEQPWLEEHRGGKSVTELEMLHGVLNNPAMAGRAFFYFRDSKWSRKQGGAYLSEGTEEKAKLEALKERIRNSGFPVLENYPGPEALADRVREDLWKLIEEAYPESEVPDALTQERMAHEAYGAARLRLYLGGEAYFKAMDDAMKEKAFRPVLITGHSGGGKSALVANWVQAWSRKHPKTTVVVHHLGGGADAADSVRLAVRLMREISRLTGDEFKPESDPEKQLEQLPQWLALASTWAQRSKKELLIVLDGLDKVSERRHMRWFPGFLPSKVKLIASCLDGEILEAAKARLDWQELKVKPFTKTEQKRFIGKYLGRYRKSLTTKQTKTLQSHPLCGSPLFLLTVLEELRVFGVHEELEKRLCALLSPPPSKGQGETPTVDDVFEHMLARIEEDIGRKGVQQAMEALWASRAGLHQDELLAIAKLAPARWAAIQNALDESLYESSGKISFGHDYLRKAVEDRYKLTGNKKLKLHHRLAEWFASKEVDARVANELPWQWKEAGNGKRLKTFLLNFANIHHMESGGSTWVDFFKMWEFCGGENEARGYLSSFDSSGNTKPSQVELSGAKITADFIASSRWLFTSVSFDRAYLKLVGRALGPEHDQTIEANTRLARHLGDIWSEDTHKEAESLLRVVYETKLSILSDDHPDVIEAQHDLGAMLSKSRFANQKTKDEAKTLLENVLLHSRKHHGEQGIKTCIAMNNLSIHYWRINRRREALKLLSLSLAKTERQLGQTHPDCLLVMNNLAAMLRDNQEFLKAEALLRKVLIGLETNAGKNHRDTLICLQDISILLEMRGDSAGSSEVNSEIFRRRGLTAPIYQN